MPLAGVTRGVGCLWLVLAGLGFLLVGGALGVGLAVGMLLVPLVLIALAFSALLLSAERSVRTLVASAALGFGYAAAMGWNYVVAKSNELANPGTLDIGASDTSSTYVLVAALTGLCSAAAAVFRR